MGTMFEKAPYGGHTVRGTTNVGTLRVVVVDDHKLTRDGLRLALDEAPGIELVGEVSEGRKALPLVGRLPRTSCFWT